MTSSGGLKMNKVQITVTRVYPKGKKGRSRSMTVKDVTVKAAYEQIRDLFKEGVI